MKKKNKNRSPLPDEQSVLELMRAQGRPLRTSVIRDMLKLSARDKKPLENILHNLNELHKITRLPSGFWVLPDNSQCVAGIFQALQSGGGKVRVTDPPDYPHKEIFISPFQTAGAWHNDIVRINILPASGGGKGKVLEIIRRQLETVPAILEKRHKRSLLFRAADARVPHRFIARPENIRDIHLAAGELASLKPTRKLESVSRNEELWEAEIIGVLGPAEKVAVQEAIVKITQKAPSEFPQLALAQAEALAMTPTRQEIASREDLRTIPFVTIDGADARDFDDAIHVEKAANAWVLRVAIADVSHYVTPDSTPGSLDAEALARGNSWYFPRSVEPMLPKKLSNGLCSLRPGEDRLAMLAEISFSSDGTAQKTRFAPVVMRSAERLIYEDVAEFFNGNTKAAVPDNLRPMLNDAFELYKTLFRKRRNQGTLDFILPEPAYSFDEDGRLASMAVAQRSDANMLIEEFMIAANEAVAEFLLARRIPVLYRDHAPPQREKLVQLYNTLKKTALETLPPNMEKDGAPDPAVIQKILANATGTSKEYIVNRLCLRSMSQARYQPDNIGHFGLASKAYCHFTSPIRRYADLLVHRALKSALQLSSAPIPDKDQLSEIADQLNGLERRAIECERDMAKRLACLALEDHVGETLRGTISGVTDFGLFVEFERMPAEGLIRIEDLGNGWHQVDQNTQSITGPGKNTRWQLGQPITVQIKSVDLGRHEIRLVPEAPQPTTKKKAAAPTGRHARNKNAEKGKKTKDKAARKNARQH